LIGLSVGLIFLAVFLKKKSEETGTRFCYFPNCRVLKELRSKPLAYSEGIQRMLANGELDSLDISRFLTAGEVDFDKSDTGASPCKLYFINEYYKEKPAAMKVVNCKDEVLIDFIDVDAGN
jgi:hypothetical protein